MRLYHGTCDAFLPEILREGLKPEPSHAFEIELQGTGKLRAIEGKTQYVFLTPHRDVATWFALYRATYERTAIGRPVSGEVIKLSGEVIPDAKPVLLTVNLPDSMEPKLSHDELSRGLRFSGSIPASLIEAKPLALKPLSSIPASTLVKI